MESTDENVERIIAIMDPFFNEYESKFDDIADTKIPVIIYQGEEDNLPDIFDRINTQGTPLTQYEVFAASWPVFTKKIDDEKIVNYLLKKYDTLIEDGYTIENYNRELFKKNKLLTSFEYLFGLGKLLNSNNILNFESDYANDSIISFGFELVNACINDSKADMTTLYKSLQSLDINMFETRLLDSIDYIVKIISPLNNFKSNKIGARKILHSKYQMISLISFVFRKKYDIQNLEKANLTWKTELKLILDKNIQDYYIYDIISDNWSTGGQGEIFTRNNNDKYLIPISKTMWENTLNKWHEDALLKKQTKQRANETPKDLVFLNRIYLNIFTAEDQLSRKHFNIEHLAPFNRMKELIEKTDSQGLPLCIVSNFCFLPEHINKMKGDKTIYDVDSLLPQLAEIETKYTFTTSEDLAWINALDYQKKDYDALQDYYFDFLRKRFNRLKNIFYSVMNISE